MTSEKVQIPTIQEVAQAEYDYIVANFDVCRACDGTGQLSYPEGNPTHLTCGWCHGTVKVPKR